MKRLALAVVLSVSVCHYTLAQRNPGNTTSSSSSSGGGSSGAASSGGGGYSGGSSHSSSSSGGGYSGSSGGSSHSSTPSGGYSGASHSSGSAGYPGGASSHSSASSHSGGNSPSHAGSGNPNSGVGSASAHSNVRNSTTSLERLGGMASQQTGSQASSGPGFQPGHPGLRPDSMTTSAQRAPQWMHQPLVADLPAGRDLNTALRKHELDSKLQSVGLEPSKSAYHDKITAFRTLENAHRPNWVARLFGAKDTRSAQVVSPKLMPCLSKECKPLPVPPKPCAGPKCPKPKPTPPPTPISGVCPNGYDSNGYCMPWGYLQRCESFENRWCVRFSSVNSNYCWRILRELKLQQDSSNQLRLQKQSVCSATPQTPLCAQLTQDLQISDSRILQLQGQYRLCRAATGWNPADGDPSDPSWPPADWSSIGWTYLLPPFF